MSHSIRILLADDHSIVRFGYEQLLTQDAEIEIVGESGSCSETIEKYRKLNPDVVILDLSMPLDRTSEDAQSTAGGFEAIKRLRCHDDKARILVATALETAPYPQHVLQAGAMGYITKRSAAEELKKAVLEVSKGNKYFSKSVRHLLETEGNGSDNSPLTALTKRELEIFTMLAEGYSVNQVADLVHLSPKTVHSHRANLLRKLGLKSNSDIIHLAVRAGIVQP